MVKSRSTPIRFAGGIKTMPEGRANLSTDLADDHPVSFPYDDDLFKASGGRLEDPALLADGKVRLDSNGSLQCTTCHEAHDNTYGKFLVMDNKESALCTTCHKVEYWETTSHRTSTATWNGKKGSPWPGSGKKTVKDNACGNCHRPHSAGTKQRLLSFDTEEGTCLSCHNGNVASKNIEADFQKNSRHRIEENNGLHDPTEDLVFAPRHAECFDCHNAHASRNAPAVAPTASGALAGVAGIDANGAVVDPIDKQYELCFRCHSDSPDRAAAIIPRQDSETNVRKEFDPSNASYHPVVAVGKNDSVPSLDSAYDESSWLYCTACHSSNTGKNAGGSGPDGPHGSAYRPILKRRMEFTDGFSESAALYALCYECHNRDSILGDESFTEHKLHIVDVKASCATCHDPHGVEGNTHLINFNVDYVKPNSEGELKWEDLGDMSGKCFLKCHDYDHAPLEYPGAGGP
jgi:predicted CXXCH cytochrome family protein